MTNVIFRGGPLAGQSSTTPTPVAGQDFSWHQHLDATNLYVYESTPGLEGGDTIMALQKQHLLADINAVSPWYGVDESELTPLASAISQGTPDIGFSSRFNETHQCVNPGLKADIILDASLVTFQLIGAPPNTYVVHAVGALRSSTTGCLFVVPVKTSMALVSAAGVAQRFHPFVAGLYFVSQWFVGTLGSPWSNGVEAKTW